MTDRRMDRHNCQYHVSTVVLMRDINSVIISTHTANVQWQSHSTLRRIVKFLIIVSYKYSYLLSHLHSSCNYKNKARSTVSVQLYLTQTEKKKQFFNSSERSGQTLHSSQDILSQHYLASRMPWYVVSCCINPALGLIQLRLCFTCW